MVIGKKLHIRGLILTPEGMFNVNVQSGGAVQPRNDTPLHISIRIADRVVVLNSFEGGAWQQEERHGGRPVREGEAFELTIKAKEGYFKIEINGKKVGKLEHRLPVELARYVHVGEGVVIESITESWWKRIGTSVLKYFSAVFITSTSIILVLVKLDRYEYTYLQ